MVIDETGNRHGRLTVTGYAGHGSGRGSKWHCRCDCGKEITAFGKQLRVGHTRSCGCLVSDTTRERSTRHGCARDGQMGLEYRIWIGMWQRCSNPNDRRYRVYGARGIKVCDRWRTYENFIEDMGVRPSKDLSIDRIDNDGHYEPGNCRWATDKEQARNKRNTIIIEHLGEKKTVPEWSEITGVKECTIRERLRHGLSAEEALKPVGKK